MRKMGEATAEKRHWFRLKMPGAFTILFLLAVIAVMFTRIVPAGSYSKSAYVNDHFQVTQPTGEKISYPATQATLGKLHIQIDVDRSKSGVVSKLISILGTYKRLEQHPASVSDILSSMVDGTIESVDTMISTLVLGGLIGVVKVSGAFEPGLTALSTKTKGKEFISALPVTVLLALGGALCGTEEEAVVFCPILAPFFTAVGYNSIACVGVVFLTSSFGTTFSAINPFSVVIASNVAGITFTQGMAGRIFGLVIAVTCLLLHSYWYACKVRQNP